MYLSLHIKQVNIKLLYNVVRLNKSFTEYNRSKFTVTIGYTICIFLKKKKFGS